MRDLLFKNLISSDKKRKIVVSSEVADGQGMHSVIRRHFICVLKEVQSKKADKPEPYLYILKERNKLEHKERFFCKIKGSVFLSINNRLFMLFFIHSLNINITASPSIANH